MFNLLVILFVSNLILLCLRRCWGLTYIFVVEGNKNVIKENVIDFIILFNLMALFIKGKKLCVWVFS